MFLLSIFVFLQILLTILIDISNNDFMSHSSYKYLLNEGNLIFVYCMFVLLYIMPKLVFLISEMN